MIDKMKRLFFGSRKRLMISLVITFIIITILLVYSILISELPDTAELDDFAEDIEARTELEEVEEVEDPEDLDIVEADEYETVQMASNPFASLLEEEVIVEEPDTGRAEPDEEDLQRQREREIEEEIRNDYEVTALLEQSHSTIARVQRRSDGQSFMLREGESVDDVTVEAIRDERVRLAKDGVGVVYNLEEEDE